MARHQDLFAGCSPYQASGDNRAQCCYSAHKSHSDVSLYKGGASEDATEVEEQYKAYHE